MADKILGTDTLRKAYPKINDAIEEAGQSLLNSSNAVSTANTAKTQSENTQTQLNTIVIDGDSSVEAAQARVPAAGTPFPTLKDRLDASDAQLAQKATVKIFNEIPTPSELLEGELGLIVGRAITPFATIFNVDATTSQLTVQGDFRNLQSTDVIRLAYAKRNIFSGLDNYLSAGMKDEGADEAIANGRYFDITPTSRTKFLAEGFTKTNIILEVGTPYIPCVAVLSSNGIQVSEWTYGEVFHVNGVFYRDEFSNLDNIDVVTASDGSVTTQDGKLRIYSGSVNEGAAVAGYKKYIDRTRHMRYSSRFNIQEAVSTSSFAIFSVARDDVLNVGSGFAMGPIRIEFSTSYRAFRIRVVKPDLTSMYWKQDTSEWVNSDAYVTLEPIPNDYLIEFETKKDSWRISLKKPDGTIVVQSGWWKWSDTNDGGRLLRTSVGDSYTNATNGTVVTYEYYQAEAL